MISRLGRYVITEEVGRGGMGVVYRARDERLDKVVALKFLTCGPDLSEDSRRRFRQEARAAAILNHPSIVHVYDYDEHEGSAYIIYEFVEGKTLDRVLAERQLDEEEIVEIGCQVAEALAYAHERGILHRDIKPQNLMLAFEGRIKILDFGLAKRMKIELRSEMGQPLESSDHATAAGMIVGTAQYMSPEQIGGEPQDGRSDLFSLGIVLYEMVAGENPFSGKSFASIVGKIMSPQPPAALPQLSRASRDLRQIIIRCLQKRKEDRYPGAKVLLDDLRRLAQPKWRNAPSGTAELPGLEARIIPRSFARVSVALLQFLYLAIYGTALYQHEHVCRFVATWLSRYRGYPSPGLAWSTALLASACCGIAVRLFLLACVSFDDPETGKQFRKLFPFLLVLDEIWAFSPLLLVGKWPDGIVLLCSALLAYLPISHRNLIRNAYPDTGISAWNSLR